MRPRSGEDSTGASESSRAQGLHEPPGRSSPHPPDDPGRHGAHVAATRLCRLRSLQPRLVPRRERGRCPRRDRRNAPGRTPLLRPPLRNGRARRGNTGGARDQGPIVHERTAAYPLREEALCESCGRHRNCGRRRLGPPLAPPVGRLGCRVCRSSSSPSLTMPRPVSASKQSGAVGRLRKPLRRAEHLGCDPSGVQVDDGPLSGPDGAARSATRHTSMSEISEDE
jgi:hypothetical protein